jgi:hypothetical protein
MGIFNIFKMNSENLDCESIKESADLYPENSLSIILTQNELGLPVTGWIDLAYENYKFKKCCPYNLQFSVEISENNEESEPLDLGTIEDYFINELRKVCIAHPVARESTDFGFNMDVYVDNVEIASKKLIEMYEDPNKLVEFGCGFNHDPQWKEYNRIIKLRK